jgi:hypothetical protein
MPTRISSSSSLLMRSSTLGRVREHVAQVDVLPRAVDGAPEQVGVAANERPHARLVEQEIALPLPIAQLRRVIEREHPLGQRLQLAHHRRGCLGLRGQRRVAAAHGPREVGEALATRQLGEQTLVILDEQGGRVLGRAHELAIPLGPAELQQRAVPLLVERGHRGARAEVDAHRREALKRLQERARITQPERQRGAPRHQGARGPLALGRAKLEAEHVLAHEIERHVAALVGHGLERLVPGVERELGVGLAALGAPADLAARRARRTRRRATRGACERRASSSSSA